MSGALDLVSLPSLETVQVDVGGEQCTAVNFFDGENTLKPDSVPETVKVVKVYTGKEPPNEGLWTGPGALSSPLCQQFAVQSGNFWVCFYQGKAVFSGQTLPVDLETWLDNVRGTDRTTPGLGAEHPAFRPGLAWMVDGSGPVEVQLLRENRTVVLFTDDLSLLREFAAKVEQASEVEALSAHAVYTGVDLAGVSEESDALSWYWAGAEGLEAPLCVQFGVTSTPDLRCFAKDGEVFRGETLPESLCDLFPSETESEALSEANTEGKPPETPTDLSVDLDPVEGTSPPPPPSALLAAADCIPIFAGSDAASVPLRGYTLLLLATTSQFDGKTVVAIRDQTAGVENCVFFPVSVSEECPTETDLYWAGGKGLKSTLCELLAVDTTPVFILLKDREVKYRSFDVIFPLYTVFDFLPRPKSDEKPALTEELFASLSVFDVNSRESEVIPINEQKLTLILFCEDWSQVTTFMENLNEWQEPICPVAIYVSPDPPVQPPPCEWVYWSGPLGRASPSCQLLQSSPVPLFLGLWGGDVVWRDAELPENVRGLLEGEEVESQMKTKELKERRYLEDVEMYRKRILELETQLEDLRRDNQLLRASSESLKSRLSVETEDSSVQTDLLPVHDGVKKNPLKQQMSEPVLDLEFWNAGNHLTASEPRVPKKLEEIAASKGLWIVSAENMAAHNKDRELGLSFLKSMKKPTQPASKASIFRSARGQVSPLRPVRVRESREVPSGSSALGKHGATKSPDLAPIAEKKGKVFSQAGGMVLNGKKT